MQTETVTKLHHICSSLTEIAGQIRDQTIAVVATNDHVQIIKHYDQVRIVTALIKESREALSKLEEKLSREWVPDSMRAAGIKNTTIEGVGRVTLGTRWSASITDRQAGYQWLRDSGNGGVIQETVNAQTLGALARELNESGVDLPQPTFTTNIMTYTSITKVK